MSESDLERLVRLYEQVNAVVQEAHGILKDLRREMKEAKAEQVKMNELTLEMMSITDAKVAKIIQGRTTLAFENFETELNRYLDETTYTVQKNMANWLEDGLNQVFDHKARKPVTIRTLIQLGRALSAQGADTESIGDVVREATEEEKLKMRIWGIIP